jgi:trk system potassium uptake protein TrkA
MNIVVIGCGRMGSELAYRFYKRGHDVAVVDLMEAAFDALPSDFSGRIIEGDAMNPDVLHRAGIMDCQALAAVTSSDTTNLVIAQVARQKYQIQHVVARNFDPRYRKLYEIFNIQGVSATGWASQRLEEMIYHEDAHAVFSAGNGEVEIYEIVISKTWNGKQLSELLDNLECVPVAITRAGKSFCLLQV